MIPDLFDLALDETTELPANIAFMDGADLDDFIDDDRRRERLVGEWEAAHVHRLPEGWAAKTDSERARWTGNRPARWKLSDDFDRAAKGTPNLDTTPSEWSRVDLGAVLDAIAAGDVTAIRPTVGRVGDSGALFYRAKVNGVAGESGSGKSFLGLVTCREALDAGETIFYLDHEDSPAGVVNRLLRMGVKASAIRERFVYMNPGERPTEIELAALRELVAELRPVLIVIDSAGEGLAIEGANPNADEDVARWYRRVPTALARVRYGDEDGPAVLLLDHVPKDAIGARSPVGSHRKKAAISGALYVQRVRKAWSLSEEGSADIEVWKDRGGFWTVGKVVARLTVVPAGDHDAINLVPPPAKAAPGTFRPTAIMDRVSRVLENTATPLSESSLVKAVGGRAENARLARDVLVAEGYVALDGDGAPGKPKLHRSLRVYRDESASPTPGGAP